MKTKKVLLCISIFIFLCIIFTTKTFAASYSSDYRYWNQLDSDNDWIKSYGCLVTAEAKLLYASGVDRSQWLNPDTYYNWKNAMGFGNGNWTSLETYANQKGELLTYMGECSANDNQLWANINAGYYTILQLSGHWVLVDNQESKAHGVIYVDQSGSHWSNLPAGGNGPRVLNDLGLQRIKGYYFFRKPTIPKNLLNLGDNFYSYILMANDITLFNVDVNSQISLQKGVDFDTKQIWNFVRQSDGSYTIKNSSTGKYIEVPDSNDYDGGVVRTNNYTGKINQKFFIYGSQDKAVIRPACSSIRTLSIDGGKNLVGKKLNMWEYWEVETQIFNIWKKDDEAAKPTKLEYSINGDVLKLNWTKTSDKYNIIINKKDGNNINSYKKIENVTGTSYSISLPVGIYDVKVENWTWVSHAFSNEVNVTINENNPSIIYTTHVQQQGWQPNVKNGAMSGTSGKRLRLEGIKIKLENATGGIQYRTHIQNVGWETSWKSNNQMSGTTGKGLRIEAIQIKLTGDVANKYDVYYRVHAQNYGWLGWAKNGESAGTEAFGYRLEAVEVKLVKKGSLAPGSTSNCYVKNEPNKGISYSTHVQNIGWQGYKNNGDISGTTGKGLRLEGIKINLDNFKLGNTSGGIQYRTHIQNIGWQNYVSNNALSGTTGKALRLEAIQIKLTGNLANKYDIYYRVHSQKFGWLGWAKNGQSAGTSGLGYRLEGIQIRLVEKGKSAPGSTANAYRNK